MKKTVVVLIILFMLLSTFVAYGQTDIDYETLDQYISKAVTDYELSGLAISIIKDDSVVFRKGYGLKDVEKNEAITTGSLFNIASCTKAFTAACLGILVEEGKLTWKDRVIDHIAGFSLADPCITSTLNIIDILSHRSGLATFYGDLLWYETDYDNQEIIKRMRYLPLKNDFRSEFGYQNNMFMIAGEIMNSITGRTWSEFVYERIFEPLGMKESRTCSQHLTTDQDIAYPHLDRKRQALSIYEPKPEGSIYSSVDEMSNWIMMLLNGGTWRGRQILSPNTIEILFTPQTLLSVSPSMKENGTHFFTCGMGWFLSDYAGVKVVEHSGGMPGYISKVALVPEEKLGLVILTNDMNNLPTALRYTIIDLFINDSEKDWAALYLERTRQYEDRKEKRKAEREAQRAKNTSPSLDLEGYTGTYEDQMYGPAEVNLTDDALHVTFMPTKEKFTSTMEHWHHDTFRIRFKDEFLPEGFITFHFNSNGEVTGFTIDLPNPDFHFFNLDFKKKNE